MNTDKDAGIALSAALSYKYAIDPRPLITALEAGNGRYSTGDETRFENMHKVAKNFGISYVMYGNQYLFSLDIEDN